MGDANALLQTVRTITQMILIFCLLQVSSTTNYVCEIRYQDGRRVLMSAYSNIDTEIVCQVDRNQVR